MNKTCLIVVAHGSRDANWRSSLEKFVQILRSEAGKEKVFLGFLELISPLATRVIEEVVEKGFDSIKILPLFISGGKHVERDLPKLVASARKSFPKIKIQLLPSIFEYPAVFDAMVEAAKKEIANGVQDLQIESGIESK